MDLTEVIFCNDISTDLPKFLLDHQFSKVVILADENTIRYCLPKLQLAPFTYQLIEIKSGEENKNIGTCVSIWEKLTNLDLDRHALLLNLGGGVIGDMGGFCAATYKRGIQFLQVPTTLLAQVDASIGGKLGVDFLSYKNHIGVFHNPAAVLIDSNFLDTLPEAEIRSGFAEIIKHCLIADEAKWKEICTTKINKNDWQTLVKHSISIKSEITTKDPLEKGLRKILNFGHTVGHAVESYFLPNATKKILHGEAVAIGMICESHISYQKGFISHDDLSAITSYILQVYGKVLISEEDIEQIIPLALHDKKNHSNSIQCTLLAKPGKATFDHITSLTEIRASITFYNLQHAGAKKHFHIH